jgi:hypothetical protein
MQDLSVTLPDQPGGLARLGEALGAAGINIDGLAGVGTGGDGVIHLLVGDGEAARAALQEAGIEASEPSDVLAIAARDQPGELGSRARVVADAGINIQAAYLDTNGNLIMVVDDLDKAVGAFS